MQCLLTWDSHFWKFPWQCRRRVIKSKKKKKSWQTKMRWVGYHQSRSAWRRNLLQQLHQRGCGWKCNFYQRLSQGRPGNPENLRGRAAIWQIWAGKQQRYSVSYCCWAQPHIRKCKKKQHRSAGATSLWRESEVISQRELSNLTKYLHTLQYWRDFIRI